MATERQIQANRLNALKSTGPKTPDGRFRSSLNALKHAIHILTPIHRKLENPKLYHKFRHEIFNDLQPLPGLETTLTLRIANTLWRLQRVQRYENQISTIEFDLAEDTVRVASETAPSHGAPPPPPYEPPDEVLSKFEECKDARRAVAFIENPDNQNQPIPDSHARALLHILHIKFNIKTQNQPDLTSAVHDAIRQFNESHQTSIEQFYEIIHQTCYDRGQTFKPLFRSVKTRIENAQLRSLIPSSPELFKIIRYERHLHFMLHRDLNALRMLQSLRTQQDPLDNILTQHQVQNVAIEDQSAPQHTSIASTLLRELTFIARQRRHATPTALPSDLDSDPPGTQNEPIHPHGNTLNLASFSNPPTAANHSENCTCTQVELGSFCTTHPHEPNSTPSTQGSPDPQASLPPDSPWQTQSDQPPTDPSQIGFALIPHVEPR